MPQDIAIGAFVLGAVLLLTSLVSGGFKIFGAEVSGTKSKVARVLAFFLGIVFVSVGFNPESVTQSQGTPAPEGPVHPVVQRTQAPAAPESAVQRTAVEVPQPSRVAPVLRLRVDTQPDQTAAVAWVQQASPGELQVLQQYFSQGADVYAAQVRLTNTGTGPVQVSPAHLHARSGGQLLPGFPNRGDSVPPTVLAVNQSVRGLVYFAAPTWAVSAGMVRIHYDDDEVQVSYAR